MNLRQNQSPTDDADRPALKKTILVPTTPATAGSKIIFIGASTGGTQAITVFLQKLPQNCPPVLIVQHMPELFTTSFAARLNNICAPQVIESKGNELIQTGTVYIAPGHSHMIIQKKQNGFSFVTMLLQSPPVNRHRPSVDVLFDSAAKIVGRSAIGVILTGMGKDGADGLLRMRQTGARTFGQDEASSIVYGMPRQAAKIGAVEQVASLADLPGLVLTAAGKTTI